MKNKEQEGFFFNEEIPPKKFIDDPTPPHTLHRKGDPDTSRDAAHSLPDIGGLELDVYRIIESYAYQGCISDKIRQHFPGLSYSSVTARYKALIDKGWVMDSGLREPGESGRNQRVLIATKFWKGDK
jgi:hypothetical protein